MLGWRCLILSVHIIARMSAIPVALRNHQSLKSSVSADCLTFTVTILNASYDNHFHVPNSCIEYDIDMNEKAKCDKTSFPMTCVFQLKRNPASYASFLSVANETAFVSVELGRPYRARRKPTNDDEMKTWASNAIAKSLLFSDGPVCKPATVGKARPRHMDCDICFWGPFPHPCNCGCRGWTQILSLCIQPCHEHEEFSFDSGAYCHKPCDRQGQIDATTGCGFGHDRKCVESSGDCAQLWATRIVDLVEVLANILPGVGTALKGAGKAARLAYKGGKAAALAAARKVLTTQARDAVTRVKNMKFITDAFKDYSLKRKDAILEAGALKFFTANLPSESAGATIALEVAKLVDPTGLVTLTANWIPPSSCDDIAYCAIDNCPGMFAAAPAVSTESQIDFTNYHPDIKKKILGYELVHQGHCATGHVGPNTQYPTIIQCRNECASRPGILYFAYRDGNNCACYTSCADDFQYNDHNAYKIIEFAKGG